MKVHGKQLLHDFSGEHPPARTWIQAWVAEVEKLTWREPQDIKNRYRSVSFVGRFVIFNVKGNDFRMVVVVAYQMGIVAVKWIGTHGDYIRINWESATHEGSRRQD